MTSDISIAIIDAIKGSIDVEPPVALHEPSFSGNEWAYVKECIDEGWVSTAGPFVGRLEDALSDFTGASHAVAMVNGTAALHLSLMLVGVGSGDEVIMPTLTFAATANAAAYIGAVPHFVDSEERTLGIDVEKLALYLEECAQVRGGVCVSRITGRPIKAVVAVHIFGSPVDLDPLVELCSRFRLTLIEDCAESLGSYYKEKHTGTFGRLSILSFNGNKTVTAGGGGAIITNDKELAKRARHLSTTARVAHRYEVTHDELGYNYRLPAINAALACAQIEALPAMLKNKRALAVRYAQAFSGVEGVVLFKEPEFARSNYWLNALILDVDRAKERDAILRATNEAGIMTRPAWTLMHKLPMYEDSPRMELNTAESLSTRIINIPSSAFL